MVELKYEFEKWTCSFECGMYVVRDANLVEVTEAPVQLMAVHKAIQEAMRRQIHVEIVEVREPSRPNNV